MLAFMTLNSTSSNGLEYLVVMKGLEFESYVCQLHVSLIVYYFDNIRDHDE